MLHGLVPDEGPGSGVYKEQRGDYFLWGLVGQQHVFLKQLCPDGVSRWRSQQTFVDGLLGVVTLGIYIPRPRDRRVRRTATHSLRLDDDLARALAGDGAPGE